MSLEETIAANTVAVEALTAALLKGGTATAATGKGAKATATPKDEKPAGPKNSREEMAAALNRVKEKHGAPAAKAIIKDTGGVDKMADIPEAKIDAVFDAAVEKEAEDEAM